MKEVKAYQCEYCGRSFKINSHVACKQSPSVKHCGDCKFHFERDAYCDYAHKHNCKLGLIRNGIPRKESCDKFQSSLLYECELDF